MLLAKNNYQVYNVIKPWEEAKKEAAAKKAAEEELENRIN
jgi:hypothetical protein